LRTTASSPLDLSLTAKPSIPHTWVRPRHLMGPSSRAEGHRRARGSECRRRTVFAKRRRFRRASPGAASATRQQRRQPSWQASSRPARHRAERRSGSAGKAEGDRRIWRSAHGPEERAWLSPWRWDAQGQGPGEWYRRLGSHIAAGRYDDTKSARYMVEHLADSLADPTQLAAAAGARLLLDIEPHLLAGQMSRHARPLDEQPAAWRLGCCRRSGSGLSPTGG
jgi:hypothetical protein